jgi:hypothetical protein
MSMARVGSEMRLLFRRKANRMAGLDNSRGGPSREAAPFDDKPFLKRSRLKESQIGFFILLARELGEAWRRRVEGMILSEMPEYIRFTTGAYACGFVCNDFSLDLDRKFNGSSYEGVLERPHTVRELPLQLVRHLVHTIVRGERWSSEVIDEENGVVRRALDSGLIGEVAARLTRILAEAHG